jgi:hypothetical protein
LRRLESRRSQLDRKAEKHEVCIPKLWENLREKFQVLENIQ